MSNRPVYFGAGPARLPDSVLKEAADATLSYKNTGLSILELPHRGAHFAAILEEAGSLVRELCAIGDEHEVLWLQGGGRLQFAMAPANFLKPATTAGYIDSGHWAHDAMETAKVYGKATAVASSADVQYLALPHWPDAMPEGLSYLHATSNNTIYGTQWKNIPACPVPLIADMSSDIFGVPRNYSQFDLFYAVAQKNLGPAGATLVVVKKEFLEKANPELAPYLSYKAHAAAHSLLNTAPVSAIFVCLLMLRWLKEKGLDNQLAENAIKAAALYDAIGGLPAFYAPVVKESRSTMNVIFKTTDPGDEAGFTRHLSLLNILGAEGHRSVGGFRASLYNSVTMDDVDGLIAAMKSYIPAGF